MSKNLYLVTKRDKDSHFDGYELVAASSFLKAIELLKGDLVRYDAKCLGPYPMEIKEAE